MTNNTEIGKVSVNQKNLYPIKTQIRETGDRNLQIVVWVNERDLKRLLVETGKQPSGMFEVIVYSTKDKGVQ